MAWPDLSDIRTEVRYALDESTASLWSDTELNRHINDAQRDIAAKSGCYTSIISTTTSANSRLIPFSGHKIRYAEYVPVSGVPVGLIFITPKMLGNISVNSGAVPQYCFQWGQNLVIEPMPLAAYTVNLYISKWPEYDMSEATDEPLIPYEFRECIPAFVEAMAFLKAKRPMTAGIHYRQYISNIQLGKQIYVDARPDRLQDVMLPDLVSDQPMQQQGEPNVQ